VIETKKSSERVGGAASFCGSVYKWLRMSVEQVISLGDRRQNAEAGIN
jgi:hypothetical protein